MNLRGNKIEKFPINIIQSDDIDLGENFIKIIPKECDTKGCCLFLDGNPIIDIEIGAKLSVSLIRKITSLDSYLNYQNRKNNNLWRI